MAVALIGGAALGAAFGELLKLVINTTIQIREFKPLLKGFKETLETIEPEFTGITELNKLSKRPDGARTTLRGYLDKGKKLVVKCSGVKKGNVIKIKKYTKKLIKLNHNICNFFQIEVSLAMMAALKALLAQDRSFDPCRAAGLLDFTVGLDQHLVNLKRKLLEDETRVLVVAAPGGFGKTTLAKKLCHDDEIKGVFGNEIIYVTVSKASLKSIGQSLHKHYGINNYEFRSEEDAKNQIETLITQKGSDKVLLVLDDVWSESIIQDLKFEIPGYKILVTCRDLFSGSRYDLEILNAKDAKTLFRYHAFTSDETDVSEETVNKIVEFCKGIPLALSVVGASLHDQPEVKWETTLLKWSKGQSIFESHQRLRTCLQTSVDALDELHRDCFLDLGLFPEDDQIAGSALMDMWIEFHGLDDKGLFASEYLRDLELKNLFTLIPIRKAAGEPGGHCSHYRVTQHDVLRELAIHLGRQDPSQEPMQEPRQEPEANRKRLFTEIRSNVDFPKWWAERPIAARILSISTDEKFSSTWNNDLNAPKVEVLILNIRSENYILPEFIQKMSELKVLIVTGYGVYPTQLNNLQVLEYLSKLHRIRFKYVSVSPFIQAIFTLKTLKKITFVMCKIGDALSSGTTEYPYTLENLKYLEIDLCYDLKELPAGLCSSVRLQKLVITNCQELDSLPKDLGNLSDLEILSLHCCTKLKALPESVRSLRKLRVLDVSDCSDITALPEQIGELSSLKAIDISGCEGLKMLPESLAGLEKLKNVTCDEERSYLWKNIESHPGKVKINFVEEDRSETFKIIYH
ncbi:putative disease resistance protein At5g66900 [Bidens hawaiensis]|uniref:putative disease resistance protein At5g66900 n=1 Tax=Bidens hawaiensis TaxID=980011 RepID=UPI00404AAA89